MVGYKEEGGKKFVQLRNPWGESEPAGDGKNDGVFYLELSKFTTLYQTLNDFEDHGRLERTVDQGLDEARAVFADLAGVGVDMADVTRTLEEEGVAAFSKSFDELITSLETKADQLGG